MSNDPVKTHRYRGVLLVVSSPSGAGKTTLCNRLRAEFPSLGFSVSYTTRPKRPGETDGVEYHFVDDKAFNEMVARDEFAEYALVHGNMYGTAAAPVEAALADGHDLLFDVDFQGGRRLRERFGDDVVLVFILPPSLAALEQRLRRRNTDSAEVIERRLRMAHAELAHYPEYHYVIVNDELERAYDALRGVYLGQMHKMERQRGAAERLLSDQLPAVVGESSG